MRKKVVTVVALSAVLAIQGVWSVWAGTLPEKFALEQITENYGSGLKNQWVKVQNYEGAKYSVYLDDAGNILTDTTAPDGSKVGRTGEWYTFSSLCPIYEAESTYQLNGKTEYPFSYDGNVIKNDALGVSLKYSESDFNEGYRLALTTAYDAAHFQVCSVNKDGKNLFEMYINDHQTETQLKGQIKRDLSDGTRGEVTYCEMDIFGKHMTGMRFVGSGTWLYCPLIDGKDIELCISEDIAAGQTEIVNWLNNHLSLESTNVPAEAAATEAAATEAAASNVYSYNNSEIRDLKNVSLSCTVTSEFGADFSYTFDNKLEDGFMFLSVPVDTVRTLNIGCDSQTAYATISTGWNEFGLDDAVVSNYSCTDGKVSFHMELSKDYGVGFGNVDMSLGSIH